MQTDDTIIPLMLVSYVILIHSTANWNDIDRLIILHAYMQQAWLVQMLHHCDTVCWWWLTSTAHDQMIIRISRIHVLSAAEANIYNNGNKQGRCFSFGLPLKRWYQATTHHTRTELPSSAHRRSRLPLFAPLFTWKISGRRKYRQDLVVLLVQTTRQKTNVSEILKAIILSLLNIKSVYEWLLPFDAIRREQKMNMSIFRRSRVAVVS